MRPSRWYGERELLGEGRTEGGRREYRADAVDRVQLIRLLFSVGVPARHVAELLPCIYTGTTTPAMVARLEQESSRLVDQATDLAVTVQRLDGVLSEARARVFEPAPVTLPPSA